MSAPLVLLHGFTGSAASWDAVLTRVPTRQARRPALLGHGEAAPDVGSFDDEVERLAALLGPEPVHLAGYSLGARLSLALAVRHPTRVARLLLVGVHPGLASDTERDERRRSDARWIELLERCGIEAFVDAWSAQALFATQSRLPDALKARRKQERMAHEPRELARSLRLTGLAEMPDLRPHLGGVQAEVTLLTGELDAKFSALATALASILPNARRAVVPGAGHDLLLERPDCVGAELQ